MPWTEPAAVLDYWIGPDDISPAGWSEKQQRWYAASDDIDSEIRARFGKTLTAAEYGDCLLYTSPSPRDKRQSRMPSSA